jgi:hypothetical protein
VRIARSRLTAKGDKTVLRRSARSSFEDIHRKIFGKRTPKKRTIEEMKEGIGEYVRERYARD